MVTVVIGSYFEEEHVARIREVDERLRVLYREDLDRLRRDKEARIFEQRPVDTLRGKTLCLVGIGSIGRAVGERARPFEMRVLGIKRTVRENDPAYGYADELRATRDLHEALGEADYVAVTLPLTPETDRLLDEAAIRAMKPGAYFVIKV